MDVIAQMGDSRAWHSFSTPKPMSARTKRPRTSASAQTVCNARHREIVKRQKVEEHVTNAFPFDEPPTFESIGGLNTVDSLRENTFSPQTLFRQEQNHSNKPSPRRVRPSSAKCSAMIERDQLFEPRSPPTIAQTATATSPLSPKLEQRASPFSLTFFSPTRHSVQQGFKTFTNFRRTNSTRINGSRQRTRRVSEPLPNRNGRTTGIFGATTSTSTSNNGTCDFDVY